MNKKICKKCNKPLTKGSICDACRQKNNDGKRTVGNIVLGGSLFVASFAIPVLRNRKKG